MPNPKLHLVPLKCNEIQIFMTKKDLNATQLKSGKKKSLF